MTMLFFLKNVLPVSSRDTLPVMTAVMTAVIDGRGGSTGGMGPPPMKNVAPVGPHFGPASLRLSLK